MSLHRVSFDSLRGWKPGNQGPSTLVKVRGLGVLDSGAGSRDNISVFKDGDMWYVLSISRGLPYVGLATFSMRSETKEYRHFPGEGEMLVHQPDGEFFAQESQCAESLGEDWEDQDDATIVRRAAEYIY